MPSPLPGRTLRWLPACAGALAVLLAAGAASALTIGTVIAARDEVGRLRLTVRLSDPLEERVERSVARGMPATLLLHAELWRKREGWFDRMERAAEAGVRLRYDVWERAWDIERPGAPPVECPSVDSLEAALERPFVVTMPGLDRVPADARCYVVLTATVKPLNAEDVQEVEGWVTGEVRGAPSGGFGVITQLPRSLFDAVRNLSGFGDSKDRAVTPEFVPAALPAERR